MTTETEHRRDHSFLIGLLTGTFVGAGLALWLSPRAAAELRQRVTDTTRDLGDRVSERYQQVSTRVVDAVDDLTKKGQSVRDDVADAVAHGAHEVERFATAAKTDRPTDARKHSAADKRPSRRLSL